jgi:peroxiredoxin
MNEELMPARSGKLMPRRPVPALEVDLTQGKRWSLATQRPERFAMLVFYRGLHCPVCRKYLPELAKLGEEFVRRGVSPLALSCDTRERVQAARSEWRLEPLEIGYGLSIDTAREWGLYISAGRGKTSIGIEEPALFCEPGIFLLKPDRTLFWSNVQSMPFARPHFDEVLAGVDVVIARDYPARGES